MMGGEIFVKKIKSIKITDLAMSIKKNAKFKITGIRPGEKIHEQMIGSDESMNTAESKDHYEILANVVKKIKELKKDTNQYIKILLFHQKQQKNFQLMNLKKLLKK